MKQWWDKFFKESLALSHLVRSKEELDRITTFLMRNLRLKANSRFFDQCCGRGDISLALGELGIQVTGVDQSDYYIKRAKMESKKYKLPCAFFKADAFQFRPSGKYDAAINWFTSFGYSLSDKQNKEMLKRVYEALKKGGYFALDYYNTAFIIKNFKPIIKSNFQVKSSKFQLIRNSTINLENGVLSSTWKYRKAKDIEEKFYAQTRIYLPVDFKNMFSNVGFRELKFFGDVDESKLTINSPRCIVIAKK